MTAWEPPVSLHTILDGIGWWNMMMIQFLKYLLNIVVGCIAANQFNEGLN